MITINTRFGDVDPEVALMLRVRDGSAEAFDDLVRLYSPYLVRRFSATWGLKEVAEDLAQEVLLRVFRARWTYVPTASLRTWIGRIALNVARNAVRRMQRHPDAAEVRAQAVSRLLAPGADVEPADPTLQRIINQERYGDILSLLDRLHPRQRQALQLVALDGKSIRVAAAEMSLSCGALKSLLARARESLRKEFRRFRPALAAELLSE